MELAGERSGLVGGLFVRILIGMRMLRRAAPKRHPSPSSVEPDPPLPPLPWNPAATSCHYPQHHAWNIRETVETAMSGALVLPTFQRPYVWEDAQVLRLLDSLLRGFHVGTVLLWNLPWDQRLAPPAVSFGGIEVVTKERRQGSAIVDGQQRIASLVRAVHADRFFVHLTEGRFLVNPEPAPWIVPVGTVVYPHGHSRWGVLKVAKEHAARWGLDRHTVESVAAIMADVLSFSRMSVIRLDYSYTRAEVVEMFRRLNTEGTPVAAEDLERALARLEDPP